MASSKSKSKTSPANKPAVKTFKSVAEAKTFAAQKEAEYKAVATKEQPNLMNAKVTPVSGSKSSGSQTAAINTGSQILNQALAQSGTAKGTGSKIADTALLAKSVEQTKPVATSAKSGFPMTASGATPGNEIGEAAPVTAEDVANLITIPNPAGLVKNAFAKEGTQIAAKMGVKTAAEYIKNKGLQSGINEMAELGAKELASETMSKSATKAAAGIIDQESEKILIKQGGKAVTNTKTDKLGKTYLQKVISKLKSPAVVAGIIISGVAASVGTKTMATWRGGEVIDQLPFIRQQAIENNDFEAIQQVDDIMHDLTNKTFWDELKEWTPWAGMIPIMETGVEANKIKITQQNKELENQQTTNLTDFDKWESIRQEQEKSRTENEESQKRIIEAWQKAKDESRESDALYWEQVLKEKERLQQEEETYWAEVRRKQAENTKSKLNFGIL